MEGQAILDKLEEVNEEKQQKEEEKENKKQENKVKKPFFDVNWSIAVKTRYCKVKRMSKLSWCLNANLQQTEM